MFYSHNGVWWSTNLWAGSYFPQDARDYSSLGCFWIFLYIGKHPHAPSWSSWTCWSGSKHSPWTLLHKVIGPVRKSVVAPCEAQWVCQKLSVLCCLFSSSKLMNNLSSVSPSINHPASLLHWQPCDKIDKLVQMSSSSALSVRLIRCTHSFKEGKHI